MGFFFRTGVTTTTSINIRGKEWINPQGEAKYFNSIVGWRIEKVQTAPKPQLPPTQQEPIQQGEPDNLPF